MTRYALGIDIGGTFTDIVLYDTRTGRQASRKELTTHGDPSVGVMTGIDALIREGGGSVAEFGRVVHATTLFTNALIERKGALTGLLTTEGFRDTLEIGRERKYELYDIHIVRPEPLVPRSLRAEVRERMLVDGQVRTPLDVASLDAAIDGLVAKGIGSLAIVFLHSYMNPAHEQAAEQRIAERHPGLSISASYAVAPEIREYERASTTACNAYIKPLAGRYLDAIAREIASRGIAAPFLLMLSNGGLTNVGEAKRSPVQLLESGPAAGALAAAYFGGQDGGRNVLAFDMGGTTAKLSVVDDGKPKVAYSFEAARQKRFIEGSGLPVRISTIELIEIGAGGGSIASVDEIGLLKVGPQSAGSEPGPAAYGRGGTQPTVTDADFLLGYLDADYFAGGTMAIDLAATRRAMAPLCERTGLSMMALAWGIHDVVNENMANAARVHIAEHGKDPRHYSLLATGGAGPVHAYYVARKLGLKRIICPKAAGVASALGLLIAPARVDRVATVACELDALDWSGFEAAFARLEAEARRVITDTGLPGDAAKIERLADIRYVGQAFELVVPLPPGPYTAASRETLIAAFETSYVDAFTRTPPSQQVEIINIRISATAEVPGSQLALGVAGGAAAPTPVKGERLAYFPEIGEPRATKVYDRYALAPGMRFDGPAVIEERESTLVVGPGGSFEVAASGNIIVTIG
ncbi:MAG: hydantoinase/oxoprolinase family protein [Hyphomicrobiaceae bacterium]